MPVEGPATLGSALTMARQFRAEVRAAKAKTEAARHRPAIVSALDDPVVSAAVDHKPLDKMMNSDRSITVEQNFPLSRVRAHRRMAAEADVGKYEGESGKALLKVQAEAAQAFFMLHERRRMAALVQKQHGLAAQLVTMAAGRHAIGAASQLDVLRAEVEMARLRNRLAVSAADIRSAEAMFNTAVGLPPGSPVPDLDLEDQFERIARIPHLGPALEEALTHHPGVQVSKAEIRRARAEVDVMKSMYAPMAMAMVRFGMADTMTAGRGYMLMVGVSVPIWFDRLKAGVGEARAMQSMAEADREAMLTMIQGDVVSTLETLRGAAASYSTFGTDLIPRAERAIGPAMAEYASGRVPLASVFEAARALWSAQEEQVMAEAAMGLAWVRLRSALGSFGVPD